MSKMPLMLTKQRLAQISPFENLEFISDCGFLGASPDSIINDHSNHSIRIVEVKCPHKARDETLDSMYSDNSFCLCLDNGIPTLKKNHEYFYQIQGQMAMTGIYVCDLNFLNSLCGLHLIIS